MSHSRFTKRSEDDGTKFDCALAVRSGAGTGRVVEIRQ